MEYLDDEVCALYQARMVLPVSERGPCGHFILPRCSATGIRDAELRGTDSRRRQTRHILPDTSIFARFRDRSVFFPHSLVTWRVETDKIARVRLVSGPTTFG